MKQLKLEDVRELLSSFAIVEEENLYMGKLDAKRDKSIGVYNLNRNKPFKTALGGDANKTYGEKQVSILVHWNKSTRETEEKALELFQMLRSVRDVTVNNIRIQFIRMLTEEPVDVNTDENNIYERVIEMEMIYER